MSNETISLEEVKRLALNTKIALTDEEVEVFREDINYLNDCVDRLNEVDTSEVEPTFFGNDVKSVLRSDEPKEGPGRDALFKNVPQEATDFIEVPVIIDNGEAGA